MIAPGGMPVSSLYNKVKLALLEKDIPFASRIMQCLGKDNPFAEFEGLKAYSAIYARNTYGQKGFWRVT